MAIDYLIPDKIAETLYHPEHVSKNSDSFRRVNLAGDPINIVGIDNICIWASDVFQELDQRINLINVDKIGVEGTQFQLLYFSDDDVLGATNLQDLIGLLPPLEMDGSSIQEQTIYGNSLRKNTLTRDHYGAQSVTTAAMQDLSVTTPKINDGAVTPAKIPANSLPFSKFVKPQTASVIGGTTTNGGAWYELTIGNYQIASKKSDNNGVTAMTLDVIWSNTAATFDGGKLTNNSVDINKLISPQYSGVIASTTTQNTFFVLPLTAWQLACRTNTSGGPTAQTLDVIWSNTAATFDGAKITPASLTGTQIQDNSVSQKKVNNYKQFVPFCMGSVNADMSLNKSLNIQGVSKLGIGLYRIAFATEASSDQYMCIPVVNDGSGTVARTSGKTTQAVVIRVTNMGGENVNAGFDFEIKDW